MFDLAIKIKNYKCFKDETGFETIRRVNLIIGKNNSGKSSLLDLIELITKKSYDFERANWRADNRPEFIFGTGITEDLVRRVFPENLHGGQINGSHYSYGRRFIHRSVKWTRSGIAHNSRATLIRCDDEGINPRLSAAGDYSSKLANAIPIPLEGKVFRRVLAERNILPEADDETISIQPDGSGITNAIQRYLNRSDLPSDVVEIDILAALNEIFAQDAVFTDIRCRIHSSNSWEIYLEEEGKGRIALSASGSGLKTVITVLACLFIVPKLERNPLSNYVFGFEELENNIHPALLRRLSEYIYRAAKEHDFVYFLTTHSSVLIDQFSKQEDAQIVHIKQTGGISTCLTAKTYIENGGILDDLDVRASDLLQANGIVWVEGPSDRVYINRWIFLWSEGELREGTHYQILFYGGRLLSHLNAEMPTGVEDGISILNANRNAIIVIDSDKRANATPVNATKRRIESEFDRIHAVCWITKGREIENYIPASVVNGNWNLEESPQVGQYSSFFEHLDSLAPGEGRKYETKKSALAEKLVVHMTKDSLRGVMDLNERMDTICAAIRRWNC